MRDPASIVASLNRRHGALYRLIGPKAGGESGATYVIADDSGTEYILKWGTEFHAEQALAITRRLRASGYPVPEYVTSDTDDEGIRYLVQRVLPGQPIQRITPRHLDRIFELNTLQAGIAAEFAGDWPAPIVESIRNGFQEWCVLDSLRSYTGETAAILKDLEETTTLVDGANVPATDAVHFDFNPANILADNGAISGVVDWNGCCAGDRGFDLITLGFYALEDAGIAQPLVQRACGVSGPEAAALYLAHMIVRQLDWSIRHHDEATISRYLGISRIAMREIRELSNQPDRRRV
ncbi:MAG TPA: aminoglycoside phosphotransferase family protein [Candidatus Binataceae bacterium]|nr:aminoglycoside phosphotransferase family protein [Candidatus Binataceae bacterium]